MGLHDVGVSAPSNFASGEVAGRREEKGVDLSVIVPTKDEMGNIEPLLERLSRVAPGVSVEIIFVDDSGDGTAAEIERLAPDHARKVSVIHRSADQRWGGLGGAVVDGIARSHGRWVCVMDGDLQHPPELIEDLLKATEGKPVDLVVASRYTATGETGSFSLIRTALSKGSTALARLSFARRLRGVSDPMSGFFMVRRDALDVNELKPTGFKILLEILVRTPELRREEVPFTFGERFAGESKASVAEARRYLIHLARLRFNGATRFVLFGTIGITGIVVNTSLLWLLTGVGGIYYLLSAILATQGSTLWNLVWTEHLVFRGRATKHSVRRRFVMFFAVNNVALALRIPVLFVLTSMAGFNYLYSNLASLAVVFVGRWVLAVRWIWVKSNLVRRHSHSYDIHGIVSVTSTVALPELERFRVEALEEAPTINVRIGKMSSDEPHRFSRRLECDEGLGSMGFATQITIGRSTDIVASRLLKHSPHVLYTNVVEPVLRWTFAECGYALVHAACLAVGDRAFLITARTDTGKTTTILKTLDSQPECSFLSDDLCLLQPDGTVLSYPKPMTISRHTVEAVKTPLLSWVERFSLVFQSRLHSRSGRQFAFRLAQLNLPVATINAIVQAVVPPPKYHVDRLVPTAAMTERATVSGLVVIQRGEDFSRPLDDAEAVEILLENCEDAYGFPPYSQIEAFLHSGGGANLPLAEKTTIRAALSGVPSTLLSSSTRDWWVHLPGLIDPARLLLAAPAEAAESGGLIGDLTAALKVGGERLATADGEASLSSDG